MDQITYLLLYNYQFKTSDVSSTTLINYANNIYDTTFYNGPVPSSGAVSNGNATTPSISTTIYPPVSTSSLTLNSSLYQYLKLPAFTMLPSYTGFTFTSWFYISASNSAQWSRLFDMSPVFKVGSTGDTVVSHVFLIGWQNPGNKFMINSQNTGPNVPTNIVSYTTQAFNLATWYHLALVATSTSWTIYVNGVDVTANGTFNNTNPTGYYLPQSSSTYNNGVYTNTFIGRSTWTTDTYLNGNVGDTRIYPIALSSDQINYIYTMTTTVTVVTATTTTYPTTTTPYSYFRMIATSTFGGIYGNFEIEEWGINFSQPQITTTPILALSYTGQYMSINGNISITPNSILATSASWKTCGISWSITASSTYASGPTPYPYYMFNNTKTSSIGTSNNVWASLQTYNVTSGLSTSGPTTNIIGVGSKLGEYFQIQSSIPVVMYSYTYSCFNPLVTAKTYYIAGSNDNINWYPIQYGNITTNTFDGQYQSLSDYILVNYNGTQTIISSVSSSITTTTFPYTTNAYTYFRFIGTQLWPSNSFGFLEYALFNIKFLNGYSYSTNYGNSFTNSLLNTPTSNILSISGNGQYSISSNISSYYIFSNYLGNLSSLSIPVSIVTTGLVMYLDAGNALSYTSGSTTWKDMTSYGMVFNLNNAPAYTTNNGGVLNFVPSSSQWAQSTTAPGFGLLSNFTIEVWIYPNGTSSGPSPTILTQSYVGGDNINYALQTTTNNTISISMFNGGWQAGSGYTLTSNNWYHVVGTYNGSYLNLYVNGILVKTDANSSVATYSARPINLMKRWDQTDYFGGGASIIRMYNSALSSDQINQNFYAEKARFDTSYTYISYNNYIKENIVASSCSNTGQYMVIVSNPTPIYGEWIQLQLATAKSITSYTINWRYSYNRMPYSWSLVGSNDGSNWTFIDKQTGATNVSTYILTYASPVYSYFRFIVTQINSLAGNDSVTDIGLISLYNNGIVIIGPNTNYTVNTNIINLNSVAVCTLTASWVLSTSTGITNDNSVNYGWIVVSNNANGIYGSCGFVVNSLTTSCYNSTGVGYQGTNTLITNNVYYSTNYGSTFTGLSVGSELVSCSISHDGSYITVANKTTVYTLNSNSSGYGVTVGANAGLTNQAGNAIAIGNNAGLTNQISNSIIFNASGNTLNSYNTGLYANPIANSTTSISQFFNLLGYGIDNQIVQSGISFTNSQQIIYGEWIQLQLTNSVNVTSYILQPRNGNFNNRNPVSWTVVGSSDGINWTILDTQNGGGSPYSWGTAYTLKITLPIYTYFRIIFTQISTLGSTCLDIGGFVLYNNGVPLFSTTSSASVGPYSISGTNNNILSLNSITVCTVTWSFLTAIIYNPGMIAVVNSYYNTAAGTYISFYGAQSQYTNGIANTGTSTSATMPALNLPGTLNVSTLNVSSGVIKLTNATNYITSSWTSTRIDISDYICTSLESYFYTRDSYYNLGGYIRILDVNNGRTDYPVNLRGGAISFGTINGLSGTGRDNNPAVERMRINCDGYVGIGTKTPSVILDVVGTTRSTALTSSTLSVSSTTTPSGNLVDINVNTRSGTHNTGKALYVTADTGDSIIECRHANGTQGIGIGFCKIYATGSSTNQDITIAARGTGRIYITGSMQTTGGIKIDGSLDDSLGGNACYYNNNTNGSWNYSSSFSAAYLWSIYAASRIAGTQIWIYSDERIKNNIISMDSKDSLSKIRQLNPINYKYIDVNANGNKICNGFIAQEMSKILPDSITYNIDFIPNIYELCNVIKEDKYMKISISKLISFSAPCRIKVILESGKSDILEIIKIIDNNVMICNSISNDINSTIFVYGSEVKDYQNVNYQDTFVLGISAIQEIDKTVQKQADIITNLTNTLNKLLAKYPI